MDYELEVGVIIGNGVSRFRGLNARDADEHIFGMVLLNDWSCKFFPIFLQSQASVCLT